MGYEPAIARRKWRLLCCHCSRSRVELLRWLLAVEPTLRLRMAHTLLELEVCDVDVTNYHDNVRTPGILNKIIVHSSF